MTSCTKTIWIVVSKSQSGENVPVRTQRMAAFFLFNYNLFTMMKTLISLLLVLLLSTSFKQNTDCIKVDIILIADMSGSIKGHENYVHDALFHFVNKFDLSEDGVRIGLITFNDDAKVLYQLGSDKEQLLKAVSTIISTVPDGTTNMMSSLVSAMNEFLKRGANQNRVVIIISDGSPFNIDATKQTANDLKNTFNSTIFGVLVQSTDENGQFMREISSLGCYVQTDYSLLTSALKKLDMCI